MARVLTTGAYKKQILQSRQQATAPQTQSLVRSQLQDLERRQNALEEEHRQKVQASADNPSVLGGIYRWYQEEKNKLSSEQRALSEALMWENRGYTISEGELTTLKEKEARGEVLLTRRTKVLEQTAKAREEARREKLANLYPEKYRLKESMTVTEIKAKQLAPPKSYSANIPKPAQVGQTISNIALNENIVGIGIPGTDFFISGKQIATKVKDVTPKIFRKISESQTPLAKKINPITPVIAEKEGIFVGEVAYEVIPKTPLDVAVMGAGASLFKAPKVIRIAGTGVVGYFGTKGALNKDLTPAQRTASGIAGGLGVAGFIFESVPYIKGAYNYLGVKNVPYFFKGKQAEGFKAIITPEQISRGRIGLIPEKAPLKTGETAEVELPTTSPLKRGGFGFVKSIKSLFTGKNQILATSQRGLFVEGQEILLERPFYVTPQDPFLKIGVTRVSRTGIESPLKIPKEVEIGFGIPQTAQIGITRGNVGVIETLRGFKIGTTPELEGIKTTGIITDVKLAGVTTIRGQGVDVYTFRIGKAGTPATTLPTSVKTTLGSFRVSGEGILGTFLTKIKVPTTAPTSIITTPTIPTTIPPTTKGGTGTISGGSGRGRGRGSPAIPTPFIPTGTGGGTGGGGSGGISTGGGGTGRTTRKITTGGFFTWGIGGGDRRQRKYPTKKIKTLGGYLFGVSVRRRGKFKSVGKGLSLSKAINLGTQRVGTTLGATFKIIPQTKGYSLKGLRTPKGFKQKKGLIFIEAPKYRLSTKGEKIEIAQSRKMKGGIF